ncbi:hypothetical protein F5884DRAFT_817204 [Xylogone sp. PMI_703]|nr:hypothetical protein F5884DRAFT_817204 [Xylogone sp. PMI_703]
MLTCRSLYNVLVTGANSFVAAHIINALITQGYYVTGSVRSSAKGEQMLAAHPEWADHLNFVTVSDYTVPGTWDAAFDKGNFDYVIHTAAPLLDDPSNRDFERDFLKPSVEGATELLKSASKYGKNVKAIVVTGSMNAMTTGADIAERTFTSAEWLPLTADDAIKQQNSYISYCVGKKAAEEAIWAYAKEKNPHYSVTVLLPGLIFGPPIQPVTDLKKINFSTDVLYSLFNGTHDATPPTPFPAYIDVRDLAAAHIRSLTVPAVANSRLLVGGNHYSSQLAIDALKSVPELKGRLPQDKSEPSPTLKLGDVLEWNKKLDLRLRTPEETFGDAARKLLALEKQMK